MGVKRYAAVLIAVAMGLGSGVGDALAKKRLLRPGTRAFFAGGQLGGAINLDSWVSQFKIAQEFGWHFSGDSSGPAIGVTVQQSFSENVLSVEMGPKFWWDFQIARNKAIYITPFVHMGFAHLRISVTTPFGTVAGGDTKFGWQFGALGKIIFNDRVYVTFQPFALSLAHGSGGTSLRWDILAGAGATF